MCEMPSGKPLSLKKGKNEILNIGTGTVVSDKAVFDAIAQRLGFKKGTSLCALPERRGL